MAFRVLLTAGCLAIPILLGAQASTEPSFQLVSIRRTPPAACPPQALCIGAIGPSSAPATMNFLDGGRFEARNESIESLVRVAFGLEQFGPRSGLIDTGALPSMRVTRFDITAIADREWTVPPAGRQVPPELRVMLRRLLETRFKLRTRMQTKKVDVAAVRRKDASPGPGLTRSAGNCLGPFTAPAATSGAAVPACAFRVDSQRLDAGSLTMPEVVTMLGRLMSGMLTRPLVDDTGLSGRWDVHVDMSQATQKPAGVFVTQAAGILRDSILDQLGLKIVNTAKPMETVKVEHAENPEED
jgi:uncharacterized protein (TIGR03435 family)